MRILGRTTNTSLNMVGGWKVMTMANVSNFDLW